METTPKSASQRLASAVGFALQRLVRWFAARKEMQSRILKLEAYNLSLATESCELRGAAQALISHMRCNTGFSADWPIWVDKRSDASVYQEHIEKLKALDRLSSAERYSTPNPTDSAHFHQFYIAPSARQPSTHQRGRICGAASGSTYCVLVTFAPLRGYLPHTEATSKLCLFPQYKFVTLKDPRNCQIRMLQIRTFQLRPVQLRPVQPRPTNPDLSNPDLSNPDLFNPDLSNPDLSNPDLSSQEPSSQEPSSQEPSSQEPSSQEPSSQEFHSLCHCELANQHHSQPISWIDERFSTPNPTDLARFH